MTYAREVVKALKNVEFPASRGDLISAAFKHDRRRDLRALLDKIPERMYYSLQDVFEETRQAVGRWPVEREGPKRRPGQQ